MKQYLKLFLIIVSLFILLVSASYSLAQSYWLSNFHFMNTVPVDAKYFKYDIQPWTEEEKTIVIQQLTMVQKYGPGLIQRVIAYGPIQVYRVSNNTVRTPQIRIVALAHPRHRYMIFSDQYFEYYKTGSKYRWFTFWAIAHELTHLADPGDKISLSKDWNQLMGWRIRAYRNAIEGQKISKSQEMKLIQKYGLITSYASKDLNEALAEYTAAVLTDRIPAFNLHYIKIPSDIRMFIKKNLLLLPFKPNRSDQLFLRANRYFIQEKYQEGIQLLTQAIAIDPSFIAAYYTRGKAWMVLEKYQNAYSDLKKSLELNPDTNFLTNRIYYSMALVNFYQKLYPQTIIYLKQAISVDSTDGFSYYYLGMVYRNMNRADLAINSFKRAIYYLPKYVPLRKYSFYYVALFITEKNQYRYAVNVLSEAVKEYPRFGAAYYLLGLNWYYLKNDRKAMSELQKALRFTTDEDQVRPFIYYYIAKIYHDHNQYQDAIENYKKTLVLNPHMGIAYFQLGGIYYMYKKNYQQSISAYKKAIRYLPKKNYFRKVAFLQIGLIYFIAGDLNNGLIAYNAAIQQYPAFALAYVYRGLVYTSLGQYALAVKDLQYAFVLDPSLKIKYGHYLRQAQEKLNF